jgi:FtsZ-interacting cell division protein ZipA
MVNQEILASLENAIERNENLEDAALTLINAGYPKEEVDEARAYVQKGVLSYSDPSPSQEIPEKQKKSGFFKNISKIFSSNKKKQKIVPEKKQQEIKKIQKEKAQNTDQRQQIDKTESSIPEPRQELNPEPKIQKQEVKAQKPQPLPSSVPVPAHPRKDNRNIIIILLIILLFFVSLVILALIFREKIINFFN